MQDQDKVRNNLPMNTPKPPAPHQRRAGEARHARESSGRSDRYLETANQPAPAPSHPTEIPGQLMDGVSTLLIPASSVGEI